MKEYRVYTIDRFCKDRDMAKPEFGYQTRWKIVAGVLGA